MIVTQYTSVGEIATDVTNDGELRMERIYTDLTHSRFYNN